MITRDPYGISGAVAPWRSLDAMEPIVERNITERDAEEAAICGQCPLPDCNPQKSWLPPTYQSEKAKTVPRFAGAHGAGRVWAGDDSPGNRILHINHRDVHERFF